MYGRTHFTPLYISPHAKTILSLLPLHFCPFRHISSFPLLPTTVQNSLSTCTYRVTKTTFLPWNQAHNILYTSTVQVTRILFSIEGILLVN